MSATAHKTAYEREQELEARRHTLERQRDAIAVQSKTKRKAGSDAQLARLNDELGKLRHRLQALQQVQQLEAGDRVAKGGYTGEVTELSAGAGGGDPFPFVRWRWGPPVPEEPTRLSKQPLP